jgi:hypothetical protein
MLSMVHLNYQSDLENQKLKYEKMLDRYRLQLKEAQNVHNNGDGELRRIIEVN